MAMRKPQKRTAVKPTADESVEEGQLCRLDEIQHNFRTTLTGATGCILERFPDKNELRCELFYFNGQIRQVRIRGDLVVEALG